MRTLILFKPDCFARKLVGECLARFERRGFYVAAIRHVSSAETRRLLPQHYREHVDKPYYNDLAAMITAGPLIACILTGGNVVVEARKIIGPYKDLTPGTIRGDYATSPLHNVMHSSADADEAAREISIWFPGWE